MFRATVPTIFIERLRRLAQCSDSETLKDFFLVRFSLASKKNELIHNKHIHNDIFNKNFLIPVKQIQNFKNDLKEF